MTIIDEAAARAWERVPVDDIGYRSSRELRELSDIELMDIVNRMEINRYGGFGGAGSSRNYKNLWTDILLAPVEHGTEVLDYGCGLGLEALMYSRMGAEVYVADIVPDNVELARRVIRLMQGVNVPGVYLGVDPLPRPVDIVHCAGVLHHIRDWRPVVEDFHRVLRPNGELRLMLYSDEAWMMATGSPTSADSDTRLRQQFTRAMDEVGDWADWYDPIRIEQRMGDLFITARCEYMTENGRYLAAVLRPRYSTPA